MTRIYYKFFFYLYFKLLNIEHLNIFIFIMNLFINQVNKQIPLIFSNKTITIYL